MSTDRVAIVTGGSRGLGREVARTLARRGYAVVIDYVRDQPAADAAAEEILAVNGIALTVRADVGDELDVQRLFAETTDAFGGVDVVVHAAGRLVLDAMAEFDLDTVDALLRTNVRGAFVVNQRAARELRAGGAIVNLSNSVVGRALPGYAAYVASKSAVEAITPVLAHELRPRRITVNTVAPELERPGALADTAEVIAFLVGTRGRWVNGQVIRATGAFG